MDEVVSVTIRVPKDLNGWLERKARETYRSKNMMVVMLLAANRDADQEK